MLVPKDKPSIKGEKRAANGKFLPGHCGGPGNPRNARIQHLRSLMYDAVTDSDMLDVTKSLLKLAKEGDIPAATLLLGYLIGKPQNMDDAGEVERGATQIIIEYRDASEMPKAKAQDAPKGRDAKDKPDVESA